MLYGCPIWFCGQALYACVTHELVDIWENSCIAVDIQSMVRLGMGRMGGELIAWLSMLVHVCLFQVFPRVV